MSDKEVRLKSWFEWVYDGGARERRLAARMLGEEPEFFAGDVWVALAVGDVARVQQEVRRDGDWVRRLGGYWPADSGGMTPLAAAARSKLILFPEFETGLLECAGLLVASGADVNATYADPRFADSPLSCLYGATGVTHHVGMTKLLLEAGANPNDNESLYHAVEGKDSEVLRVLLAAGARVTGTNALGRVLDYDKLEELKLLLESGGDANERPWVHHAILRGRSIEHVRALVEGGADLRAVNPAGDSLYRYAERHGRLDVLALLRAAGVEETEPSIQERFVAACARADLAGARALLESEPGMFSKLSKRQLKVLPEMAEVGELAAVSTMLAVGWPREVMAGWGGTALNLAVFNGNAAMAELLLREGADWRTEHAYKDNVLGTLSWASRAEDLEAGPGDYAACARVLLEHGVPLPREKYVFSPEVEGVFDGWRLGQG